MRQIGKEGLKWQKTRREWVKANPPNFQGYYTCYLCSKWVPAKEMELDHVLSRSGHPELRHEFSNLMPSCHPCNTKKGSKKY